MKIMGNNIKEELVNHSLECQHLKEQELNDSAYLKPLVNLSLEPECQKDSKLYFDKASDKSKSLKDKSHCTISNCTNQRT